MDVIFAVRINSSILIFICNKRKCLNNIRKYLKDKSGKKCVTTLSSPVDEVKYTEDFGEET